MNLMFWKKKVAAEDSKNISPEQPEGEAASQQSPDLKTPSAPEALSKPRLNARIGRLLDIWAEKLDKFIAALALRFKRTPSSISTEDDFLEADTPVGSEVKKEHAAIGALGIEPSSVEPAKTGLIERVISKLATVIQGREKPVLIGVLSLFLIEIGYIAWSNIHVSVKEEAVTPVVIQDTGTIHPALPAKSQVETSLPVETTVTEIDVLKKKNAALQAQLETLKNAQIPVHATNSPARQGNEQAKPVTNNDGLTIGSADPKANAMTLKQAIEAMNAGAGEYVKKPAPNEQTKKEAP